MVHDISTTGTVFGTSIQYRQRRNSRKLSTVKIKEINFMHSVSQPPPYALSLSTLTTFKIYNQPSPYPLSPPNVERERERGVDFHLFPNPRYIINSNHMVSIRILEQQPVAFTSPFSFSL